jgi:hypothetical protein
LRLAVYAEDLLLGGVSPSGQVTGFGGRDPIAAAEDTGDVDAFAAEMIEELAAGVVIADYADGEDAGAEIG